MNKCLNIQKFEKRKQLKQWYEEGYAMKRSSPNLTLELAERILYNSTEPEYAKYRVLGTFLKAACLVTLGENDEALQNIQEAERLHRLHLPQDKSYLFQIIKHKGLIYWYKGNNQLAVDAYLRCLSLGDEAETAGVYINLSIVYSNIKDSIKAIEYLQKAKMIAGKYQDIFALVSSSYNLIPCYVITGKLDAAKQEALWILKTIDQHPEEKTILETYKISSMGALGEIYRKEQSLDKALAIQKQAFHEAEQTSMAFQCCSISNYIGRIYINKQDEKNALIFFQKALDYANESGLKSKKKQILEEIISFYKSTNQLTKAFPFHEMLYKLLQEQLTESTDNNLQKIITEREQEIQLLEEKNHEIEEKNAIHKQFTHIISHDLREPIRGITGFASLLNKKYAESLDETANEYLRFILSEANLMNRNLARLLKYTTIERNTDRIKEIDIQKIIHQIEYQYQNEPFELNIIYQGASLNMQPEHAELLLTELIGNAIQFKKENEECKIEIKNELKEGYNHLSVKDYGIGIDPIYHNKIFKIFNKINKHAGAGLAICERITQLYKGEISIKSIPQKHTTFHIKISIA